MRITILGSAAGGGFPQWNCNCRNCAGVRDGSVRARPRTQSSLFVRPDEGADGITLFRQAATALAASKATPLRVTSEFDRASANEAKRRVRLTSEIQQAIASREFLHYYQPKIDLRTGAIVGAEALLRWRRPNGMLMLPGEFLGAAEDSGLIIDIDAVTFPSRMAGV